MTYGAIAVLMMAAACMMCVMQVQADLPIHCLNLHVAGAWTFSLSAGGGNSTSTTCGYKAPDTNAQHFLDTSVFDFDTESTYQVVLARPATAYDADGNYGTWTMIYDEGFEVRINGRVFFAFMKYSPNDGTNTLYNSDVSAYTSDCSATMTGWYRNDDNTNWGCWSGAKYTETDSSSLSPSLSFSWASAADVLQTTAVSSTVGLASEHIVSQTEAVFKLDRKFVARVNRDKTKTWKAKIHMQFEGKKVKEMLALSGASRSHKILGSTRKQRSMARKEARSKRAAKRTLHSLSSLGMQADYGSLPENFDWRNVNGVNYDTPVVNQGSCGSCYAVASAAAYEARVRVASNMTLQPYFSAQEILSCSITNQGCEGGFPYLVGKHGVEQGFVETSAFGYLGSDSACPDLSSATRWKLSNYGYIGGFYGNNSELAMMQEIYNNGPIVIAFECPTAMFYYDGGIFDGECDVVTESQESDEVKQWEATNHAVIGVGWGVENGVKYWIIKNTWGASWGESGYFRIVRGVDECAVESMSSFGTPLITEEMLSARR